MSKKNTDDIHTIPDTQSERQSQPLPVLFTEYICVVENILYSVCYYSFKFEKSIGCLLLEI